jgi:hypothetical protein
MDVIALSGSGGAWEKSAMYRLWVYRRLYAQNGGALSCSAVLLPFEFFEVVAISEQVRGLRSRLCWGLAS